MAATRCGARRHPVVRGAAGWLLTGGRGAAPSRALPLSDPGKAGITIRQLLSMTSGIRGESFGIYGAAAAAAAATAVATSATAIATAVAVVTATVTAAAATAVAIATAGIQIYGWPSP